VRLTESIAWSVPLDAKERTNESRSSVKLETSGPGQSGHVTLGRKDGLGVGKADGGGGVGFLVGTMEGLTEVEGVASIIWVVGVIEEDGREDGLREMEGVDDGRGDAVVDGMDDGASMSTEEVALSWKNRVELLSHPLHSRVVRMRITNGRVRVLVRLPVLSVESVAPMRLRKEPSEHDGSNVL